MAKLVHGETHDRLKASFAHVAAATTALALGFGFSGPPSPEKANRPTTTSIEASQNTHEQTPVESHYEVVCSAAEIDDTFALQQNSKTVLQVASSVGNGELTIYIHKSDAMVAVSGNGTINEEMNVDEFQVHSRSVSTKQPPTSYTFVSNQNAEFPVKVEVSCAS